MLWWLIAAAVGVPVIWFLFTAFLGFIINPEFTGKALFKKKLKQYGLDPSAYPKEIHSEIAMEAVRFAKMLKEINKEKFNIALVNHLVGRIEMIGAYERGELNEFDMKDAIVQKLMAARPVLQVKLAKKPGVGN